MNPFKKITSEEPKFDLEFFTIYDSKTKSYDVPTFAVNKNDLIRQILNMFKDPSQRQNKFLMNAEDFSIFKIGSYSKHTGTCIPCALEHVANMHDLRSIAQPDLNTQTINDVRDSFKVQAELQKQ